MLGRALAGRYKDPVLHPEEALFDARRRVAPVPACDHYAGSETFIRKALRLQAEQQGRFDVTLDLEDGAPAGDELGHAHMVVELLNSPENAHDRAGVRIHDPSHACWQQDVDVVLKGAGGRLAHITIPKVVSARQVSQMITYVQNASAFAGLEREIPIHVLVETHGAVGDARKIAALPCMRGLDFGLMDYVSAHQGALHASTMRSPGQFDHAVLRHAKTIVATSALGSGLVPVHNVTIDLDDPEQAYRDARRARDEFGYLRMWSIHPSQIEPILRAFTPDDDELNSVAEILLAAQRVEWAPLRHEGRLHDRASYRYCWHVLQRGRMSGAEVPAAARLAFFDGRD